MFRSATSILALTISAAMAAPAAAETGKPHWGYEGAGDPSVWSELSPEYAACGAGTEQSPIDIHAADAIAAEFAPVEINWNSFTPEVVNNGHTIQVNTDGEGGFANVNGVRYDLLQYHFHAASEHTIDGEHGALEVHFVHKSEAGDLLVVGALIEEGEENPALAKLWPLMPGDEGAADRHQCRRSAGPGAGERRCLSLCRLADHAALHRDRHLERDGRLDYRQRGPDRRLRRALPQQQSAGSAARPPLRSDVALAGTARAAARSAARAADGLGTRAAGQGLMQMHRLGRVGEADPQRLEALQDLQIDGLLDVHVEVVVRV